MAVVTVNYIRNRKGRPMRTIAKETLSYMECRPGENKEEMTRTLFSWGGGLSEEQAMEMIDNAPKGTRFWRIMVSPDPKTEDTKKDLDLWQVTKHTLSYLEEKFNRDIEFVAAEHADHTDKKHIHSVVLLKWGEHLYEPELMALINAATDASLSQRYARDKMLEQQNFQQQAIQQYRPLRRDFDNSRLTGVAGGKAHRVRHYKEPALACPNGVLHETVKLKSGKHWCQECAKVLERDGGLSL